MRKKHGLGGSGAEARLTVLLDRIIIERTISGIINSVPKLCDLNCFFRIWL